MPHRICVRSALLEICMRSEIYSRCLALLGCVLMFVYLSSCGGSSNTNSSGSGKPGSSPSGNGSGSSAGTGSGSGSGSGSSSGSGSGTSGGSGSSGSSGGSGGSGGSGSGTPQSNSPKFLYSSDFSGNRVLSYLVNATTGVITPTTQVSTPAHIGPTRVAADSTGNHLYV